MKKIILSAFLLISTAVSSQQLDDAYLESLPEDIRADVQQNIDNRDNDDKPVYRRPSSMTKKPDDKTEDEDKDEPARFGTNIFNMMQSSFMPINEPNFDSSYILDFGDILEIQLVGQKNKTEKFSIKRDGSISFPEVGKIFLSGLSMDSASSLIKSKIGITYIGVEAFITLTNIRDIQILVAGNAYNPGIYIVNGNSNLLHVLNMAGGIDDKGSFRQVDLIRNNKLIESIDLYDVFISGRSSFSTRLKSGDSILVKPSKLLVTISGGVNRPSTYELTSAETFEDILRFANGFSATADTGYIRVERIGGNEVSYTKLDKSNLTDMDPEDGDTIYIRNFVYRSVKILGSVNTPGTYYISEDETLRSLIRKAEGFKKNAYPFAGTLINQKTLEINEVAKEKLYTSFIQALISKGDALFASDSLPLVLDVLKDTKVSGRIMVDFDLDVIDANPELDTTLENGDVILIPAMTQQVYIYGEVNNPGTLRYKANKSVVDYLTTSGGTLSSADDKNIFVVHPNGEVNVLNKRGLSFLNGTNDVLIYPGTIIYVPRRISTRDPTTIASIWAPILSALAVSLTSLSILDK
tara:strand:+ start:2977 stop:4716 length:1740 start_codon:yes stop_codon:yes gene_type:complete